MAEAPVIGWRTLRVVAIVFFVLRVVLLFTAKPFMDETYYWLWGQHPALSYFDHPSLIGWTQGLASVLGWNIVALRLPVLLTLCADIWLLWLITGRDDEGRQGFWLIAAIFLSAPIFLLITGSALPDHLLMCFALLAVLAQQRFAQTQAPRWLYLAGLAIGLATLSKYTGALLGAGALLWLIATPRLRPTFRSPHFYVAALLAVALQTPVLFWNLQHNLASFGFAVMGRSGAGTLSLDGVGGFFAGAVAVLSPFLIWPLLRFALARGDGHLFSRSVFWLSSLTFFAASFFTNILIHWNAVAYVVVLPFLLPYLRARVLVVLQLIYGAGAIILAGINFTALPVTALFQSADRTSSWSYGWDDVAAAVAEIRQSQPGGFIATPVYGLSAQLGFALHDASVTSLPLRRDAFSDWFDPVAHRGQSALLVTDSFYPVTNRLRAQFQSVTPLRTLDVVRYGHTIERYTISLATGFNPG